MLIEKDIAAQIETCSKQTLIAVTKRYPQGQILELSGGAACFSGINSCLSRVVGWGFATKPKQLISEIEQIEAFYKGLKMPQVTIEISPYVGNELIEYLGERGYRVEQVSNVSVLELTPLTLTLSPKGAREHTGVVLDPVRPLAPLGERVRVRGEFTIRQIQPSEINEWAKHVSIGFGCADAVEHFITYASAENIHPFAAFSHNKIVSGAIISIQGKLCDLGVTSTLHNFRGRGLQKQLLNARLNFAKNQNLKLATVTTEPGSVSDLNVQKIGFKCAYSRMKMNLSFKTL